MSPLDILLKSRDHFDKVPWIRGLELDQPTHGHCAVGAINCAIGRDYDTLLVSDERPLFLVYEYLGEACGIRNIPNYNDNIARSKQDVLDMFDKAIEMAEALEHPPEPVPAQDVLASGASVSEQLAPVLVTS